jgi:toxin ParE1/3/4
MAYQIVWARDSHRDLESIVRYIAHDSPQRAQSFALRLIASVDRLQEHPESGRQVPELDNPSFRELIFRPCRIVYRTNHVQKVIEIVRVWHAARGSPEISSGFSEA